MQLQPRDLVLGAGVLVLGVVGLLRLAEPQPTRMRAISVEAVSIPAESVDPGQTVTREADWQPPDDVYLLGWLPVPGAPEAEPELLLRVGELRLFEAHGHASWPSFFPAGSGFLVRKGQPVTLRLTLVNSGPRADTRGARALLYFVPVAGN